MWTNQSLCVCISIKISFDNNNLQADIVVVLAEQAKRRSSENKQKIIEAEKSTHKKRTTKSAGCAKVTVWFPIPV
jgi:hypothetical protein